MNAMALRAMPVRSVIAPRNKPSKAVATGAAVTMMVEITARRFIDLLQGNTAP